jgi:hypothetical protein
VRLHGSELSPEGAMFNLNLAVRGQNYPWATLMARVLELDVLACPLRIPDYVCFS